MTTIHKFPLQMVVLLMFNTRDSLTYEEIKEVGTYSVYIHGQHRISLNLIDLCVVSELEVNVVT